MQSFQSVKDVLRELNPVGSNAADNTRHETLTENAHCFFPEGVRVLAYPYSSDNMTTCPFYDVLTRKTGILQA